MPGLTTHPLTPPIFNFPPEKKHRITVQDLISILRYCQIVTGYASPPREQTRAQYCADALDQIAYNPERKRIIFRHWPRSPTGAVLVRDNPTLGMSIPNGWNLWGETMFDFFQTERIPSVAGIITFTTGSKMMEWAKANNETEVAKGEIEWAETENQPKRLEPYSMKKRLERQEKYLRLGISGESCRNQDQEDVEIRDPSTADDIFHKSNLPSPWPFVPFSYQPETLQTRIPLHRLPKTITVHDPWDLLSVKRDSRRIPRGENRHWSSAPDRSLTYRLQLTETGKEKVEEELAMLNSLNPIHGENTLEGYFLDPLDVAGPRPPAVWIVPPPRPPRETQTQAPDSPTHAHLYLSPSYKLGEGHHSIVYEAEWDLPRSLLFGNGDNTPDLVHCQECGKADARTYLKETDGEKGEKMEMKWKTPSAYNRKTVSQTPEFAMEVVNPSSKQSVNVITCPGRTETRYEYEGDVRTVHTSVGWQDPRNPICPHVKRTPASPPFARVRVAAKLSLPRDCHLKDEAENYQLFEQRMFEHWNGLSLVRPCYDPVPNGPIVPQFYGYYVPEDAHKVLGDDGRRKYLSPILLLELCGEQIDPDDLTLDEANEVSSLFHRFHREGWTHNSVYTRNILYQYGPLHVPYSQRQTERSKRQLSFRLIDFGRSELDIDRKGQAYEPNEEENDVESLFGHLRENLL